MEDTFTLPKSHSKVPLTSLADIAIDVALLQQTSHYHDDLLTKLENTNEKISEILSNVNKILAVSETKSDIHKKSMDDLCKVVEDHTNLDNQKFKEVVEKIEENSEKFVETIEKHNKSFRESIEDLSKEIGKVSSRLTGLENLKWVVIGVLVVVLYLTNSNVSSILGAFHI